MFFSCSVSNLSLTPADSYRNNTLLFFCLFFFLPAADHDSEAKRVQDVLSGMEKPQVGLEYELQVKNTNGFNVIR